MPDKQDTQEFGGKGFGRVNWEILTLDWIWDKITVSELRFEWERCLCINVTNVMRRAKKEIESTQTKLRFDGIGRHTFWTADTDGGSEKPKKIWFWPILIEECVDRYKNPQKEHRKNQQNEIKCDRNVWTDQRVEGGRDTSTLCKTCVSSSNTTAGRRRDRYFSPFYMVLTERGRARDSWSL